MAGCPRVTHPSATKSYLLPSEEFHRYAPFDLHVLGTPPAFILSQDQTLDIIYLPRNFPAGSCPLAAPAVSMKSILVQFRLQDFLFWLLVLRFLYFLVFVLSEFSSVNCPAACLCLLPAAYLRLPLLQFTSGIFQGCITVYLSRCCCIIIMIQTEKEGFEPSRRY